MAQPLFTDFQCIFFDQRGTGFSKEFLRDPATFALDLLLSDVTAVLDYFDIKTATLIGHSWGAMYSLYSCMADPERFPKAALLNMGPLDAAMEKATTERLLEAFSAEDRELWQSLRAHRRLALDAKDSAMVADLDQKLMKIRVKAWIHDPRLRERYLDEHLHDPPADREVNSLIWEAQRGWFSWASLSSTTSSLWLCSGATDSVPRSQGDRVALAAPFAKHTVYQECGHIPWFDCRDQFQSDLLQFLRGRPINTGHLPT
jgi:pimeloyl-ACP methyl ester carboxylesterase